MAEVLRIRANSADLYILKANHATWDVDPRVLIEATEHLLALTGTTVAGSGIAADILEELLGGFVAPDPFVLVHIDGRLAFQSATIYNSYDPIWSRQAEVEVSPDSSVVIQVWDEDVSEDDPAGSVVLSGGDLLRALGQPELVLHEFGRVSTLSITVVR